MLLCIIGGIMLGLSIYSAYKNKTLLAIILLSVGLLNFTIGLLL